MQLEIVVPADVCKRVEEKKEIIREMSHVKNCRAMKISLYECFAICIWKFCIIYPKLCGSISTCDSQMKAKGKN